MSFTLYSLLEQKFPSKPLLFEEPNIWDFFINSYSELPKDDFNKISNNFNQVLFSFRRFDEYISEFELKKTIINIFVSLSSSKLKTFEIFCSKIDKQFPVLRDNSELVKVFDYFCEVISLASQSIDILNCFKSYDELFVTNDASDLSLDSLYAKKLFDFPEYLLFSSKNNCDIKETSSEEKPLELARTFIKFFFPLISRPSKKNAAYDIFQLLYKLEKTNDEIQNDMVDSLGFEHLEFIEYLLKHRLILTTTLVDLCHSFLFDSRISLSSIEKTHKKDETNHKNQMKTRKKLSQQFRKLYSKDFNEQSVLAVLKQIYKPQNEINQDQIYINDQTPFNNLLSQNPNIFDKHIKNPHGSTIYNNRILPPTSSYLNFDDHTLIHIPADFETPPDNLKNVILIKDLSLMEQKIFKDIPYLNIIQSLVYNVAVNTSENMLICAPTGAGKTIIAVLTIIREVLHNSLGSKGNQCKIVYIAPMKALASEVTKKLSEYLSCLKLVVKELTGDTQLSSYELSRTHIIVSTPEKWDVVTRKQSGDVSLALITKLLIIDEIHLLQDERGPVIEALVARTLQLVESSQTMIRLVGLSATLPNYVDVASFMCVNINVGLYYFDSRFRSVPLEQTFIGVKGFSGNKKSFNTLDLMYEKCYEKMIMSVKLNRQVMIFVHTRNSTWKVAEHMKQSLVENNDHLNLTKNIHSMNKFVEEKLKGIKNHKLVSLIHAGIAVHHAGMPRKERDVVEALFLKGYVKLLVCTATLSWGVNLPAHTVIICGTDVYDSSKGSFQPLGILDVQQIFGRAGRPQFTNDVKTDYGHAILITKHKDLDYFITNFIVPLSIESQLLKGSIMDSLNAEISLGSITNLHEGLKWFKYTYAYVRLLKNPMHYGVDRKFCTSENSLLIFCRKMITTAIKQLDLLKMIRYNPNTESISSTQLGRIASLYYISCKTISVIDEHMQNFIMDNVNDENILRLLSKATEFGSILLRQEEQLELNHLDLNVRRLGSNQKIECEEDKIFVLLQCYISEATFSNFSLISDMNYIAQNAGRLARGYFEIAIYNNWSDTALLLHRISRAINLRVWMNSHWLEQFKPLFKTLLFTQQQDKMLQTLTPDVINTMSIGEMKMLLRQPNHATLIKKIANCFPAFHFDITVRPISSTILKLEIDFIPQFYWDNSIYKHFLLNQGSLHYVVWIQDHYNKIIQYFQTIIISLKDVVTQKSKKITCFIAIPSYSNVDKLEFVCLSEEFMGADYRKWINVDNIVIPEYFTQHTDLLPLRPLPISSLHNPDYQKIYNFEYFNSIQTQMFHVLYHKNNNILLGAPTGSGKTVIAEFAIMNLFNQNKNKKVVYIGPLKALVRERVMDWKNRFENIMGKKVIELSGEAKNDKNELKYADILVTTPEKWDGMSRGWKDRKYVQDVGLIIIDEVHMLGETRGPVIEAIVSRIHYLTENKLLESPIRIIALSTSTANSIDLARWLRLEKECLFNFRPSVRPVPVQVHISGFSEPKYCPRMNSMNKTVFESIKTHSNKRPVLIFVSSRRQTKRTASALINYLSVESDPRQWLNEYEEIMMETTQSLKDEHLKLYLMFGVAIHHAGLDIEDRKVVERLFSTEKVMILIATSTLAWGVNFPAHCVIIKGTEYYDGITGQYVDFPITDVLQMMGRAGRPQFDTNGIAVILVHDMKKEFYKKFLYEPFPIESNLIQALPDHVNAEIASLVIRNEFDAIQFLKRTFLMQRIFKNPSYYIQDWENFLTKEGQIDKKRLLNEIVYKCFATLVESNCIKSLGTTLGSHKESYVETYTYTFYGKMASFYYLSHKTIKKIQSSFSENTDMVSLLITLSNSTEFAQFPVRHNEDELNEKLAIQLPLEYAREGEKVDYGNPHVKAFLLFQAHFGRIELPISDYVTDTRSLLDQALRILQAMLDIASHKGYLNIVLYINTLMQSIIQGSWWWNNSSFYNLPYVKEELIKHFNTDHIYKLKKISDAQYEQLENKLLQHYTNDQLYEIRDALSKIPIVKILICIYEKDDDEKLKFLTMKEIMSKPFVIDSGKNYNIDFKLINGQVRENVCIHSRFPKPKDPCWMLMIGDAVNNKVISVKRISSFVKTIKATINFGKFEKNQQEEIEKKLNIYLLSDCIYGIDQEYSFNIIIK